jgi:hypothetical protein
MITLMHCSAKGRPDTMTSLRWSSLRARSFVGVWLAVAYLAGSTFANAAPKIGLVLKPLDNTYFGAMARGRGEGVWSQPDNRCSNIAD